MPARPKPLPHPRARGLTSVHRLITAVCPSGSGTGLQIRLRRFESCHGLGRRDGGPVRTGPPFRTCGTYPYDRLPVPPPPAFCEDSPQAPTRCPGWRPISTAAQAATATNPASRACRRSSPFSLHTEQPSTGVGSRSKNSVRWTGGVRNPPGVIRITPALCPRGQPARVRSRSPAEVHKPASPTPCLPGPQAVHGRRPPEAPCRYDRFSDRTPRRLLCRSSRTTFASSLLGNSYAKPTAAAWGGIASEGVVKDSESPWLMQPTGVDRAGANHGEGSE